MKWLSPDNVFPGEAARDEYHLISRDWGTKKIARKALLGNVLCAMLREEASVQGCVKARLHMRFFMRFRCDLGAILRTKPAPAYPTRVFSRVTLRRNTVKLAGIGRRMSSKICHTFLSNPLDASRKKTFVQGRVRRVLYAKSHQKSHQKSHV